MAFFRPRSSPEFQDTYRCSCYSPAVIVEIDRFDVPDRYGFKGTARFYCQACAPDFEVTEIEPLDLFRYHDVTDRE